MFAVYCPRHQRRVLLDTSNIVSLTGAPDGQFVIGYRCTCGYEGQWPQRSGEDGEERMAG
jgi:hypothetical protein